MWATLCVWTSKEEVATLTNQLGKNIAVGSEEEDDFAVRGRHFASRANGDIPVDMMEHAASLEATAAPRSRRQDLGPPTKLSEVKHFHQVVGEISCLVTR